MYVCMFEYRMGHHRQLPSLMCAGNTSAASDGNSSIRNCRAPRTTTPQPRPAPLVQRPCLCTAQQVPGTAAGGVGCGGGMVAIVRESGEQKVKVQLHPEHPAPNHKRGERIYALLRKKS